MSELTYKGLIIPTVDELAEEQDKRCECASSYCQSSCDDCLFSEDNLKQYKEWRAEV